MKKEMLRIGEAAIALGVTIHTLRRWVKKGWVPAHQAHPTANFMFDIDELAEFKHRMSEGLVND